MIGVCAVMSAGSFLNQKPYSDPSHLRQRDFDGCVYIAVSGNQALYHFKLFCKDERQSFVFVSIRSLKVKLKFNLV